MLPPDQDIVDRLPIWEALQIFWLDTGPAHDLRHTARLCATSKYSLAEIEQIFWNEVRPALCANLHSVAGEWAGFDSGWLAARILQTHRFGKRLPARRLHPGETECWKRLWAEIEGQAPPAVQAKG